MRGEGDETRECGEPEYGEYLRMYEEVASMSPNVISEATGCLPSCRRGEFEATVVDSMAYDMGVEGERILLIHLFFPRYGIVQNSPGFGIS